MLIAKIKVGKRHRKDLGDIASLATSIKEVGLLHPIVAREDGTLIAGERRLAACKQLGWKDIAATIIDIDEIVRGEFAENSQRKDFLPTEIDAIRRALEPIEREAAKERMREGGKGWKVSTPSSTPSKTRDRLGAFAGVSGRTVEKIAAIVEAAEGNPKFQKLVEEMDRTGRVNGAFKRLKVAKQADAIQAEPPPLPGHGPYRVIVVDPPWPYEARREDPSHRAAHPYPQMSIEQICKMGVDVGQIAHDDCVLWLWTTNHHMREAFKVLDAWDFEHKTILTWVKDRMGMG